MDRYYECGGRSLDTARAYMAWVHNGASKSEKTVGDWIKSRGMAKEMTVITKCAHPELRDVTKSRLSPDCLEYDINTSLAVLDLDRVQILFPHRDDEQVPVGEIMDAFDNIVKDGLVEAIGASNWSARRVAEANEYARKNGRTPFTVIQTQWNMAQNKKENMLDQLLNCMTDEEYVKYLEIGLPVMAYSSQAVGFFAKYINGQEDTMAPRAKAYYTEENIRRAERAKIVCERIGCSPSALCIAYITCNPLDGYALIASSKMEQMEDSMTACDLAVDWETLKWITTGG
jgi:aryl-alcohol dehydrogenase-like predicted oxidoreductase